MSKSDLEKQSDYQRRTMWLSNRGLVGGSDLSGGGREGCHIL